jgi:hypothetical protein
LRRAQAQGRVNLQPDAGIALRSPIELVDQRIRLAYPQGQGQHHVRPDPAQGVLYAFGNIVEEAGHFNSLVSAPMRN